MIAVRLRPGWRRFTLTGIVVSVVAVGCGNGPDTGAYPAFGPGIPDKDCADLPGAVAIDDKDPHNLDADGNGIGCEWGPDGQPDTGDEDWTGGTPPLTEAEQEEREQAAYDDAFDSMGK